MSKGYLVDFKELKGKMSMEMLLIHYQLFDNLKLSAGNFVGCCPIHKGSNVR